MKYLELLESAGFEDFIADRIRHHDALERLLPVAGRRSYIIASARQTIAQDAVVSFCPMAQVYGIRDG